MWQGAIILLVTSPDQGGDSPARVGSDSAKPESSKNLALAWGCANGLTPCVQLSSSPVAFTFPPTV